MALIPEDISSLTADDIVVKSTPQQRNDPPKEEKPKEEPIKVEDVKKVESKKEESKKPDVKDGKVPPATTEEEKKTLEDETGDEEEDEDDTPEDEGEFNWEALSEEVGIELDSDDSVVESLKELASYKNLSPALQRAIEIERNNGDVASYFKAIANDPKDLSDQDALWEQYVADNPKRIAANPKFARLDFERKTAKEYSLLNEYEKLPAEEQEEFLDEHKAELEYLKEKRKFDAEAARASLQEIRDKATFNAPKAEIDEKKIKASLAEHEKGYKAAIAEFDVMALKVGKDFEFNVGVSDGNKKQVNEWMKNPDKFLNELGFTNGKVDYDTLMGWATLISDIKY